jgi:hypothetical protein
MKRFKIEGWYRYNDDKDFMWDYQFGETPNEAIENFKRKYSAAYFYRIDIKEIV